MAPGWLFLFAAFFITIVVIVVLIQRHRRPTALKQALEEFDRLFAIDGLNHVQRYQEISLILKKLAVTTNPREDVAGLSGNEWIAWIQSRVTDGVLSTRLLEFLKLGPYSDKEDFIQDQDAFRAEMQDLLIAVGGPKESLISKWLERLPRLKSTRAK